MAKMVADTIRMEDNGATEYLLALGKRVRSARAQRGMTRKILARDSGVSERYLAKLETGQGNASVLVLRQISSAMDMDMQELLSGGQELIEARQLLQRISEEFPNEDLGEVIRQLRAQMVNKSAKMKGRQISLIGLRGAGKSTLGKALAAKIGFDFVELNAEVENDFGASLAEIFSLAGQPSFRRYEHRCLKKIIDGHADVVIATGGSIVANEQAFSLLLERTNVIWLQAAPEEHMSRVVAQGDTRPIAGSREAMADLKQILEARKPLYEQADIYCDTTRKTARQSLVDLNSCIDKLGITAHFIERT